MYTLELKAQRMAEMKPLKRVILALLKETCVWTSQPDIRVKYHVEKFNLVVQKENQPFEQTNSHSYGPFCLKYMESISSHVTTRTDA